MLYQVINYTLYKFINEDFIYPNKVQFVQVQINSIEVSESLWHLQYSDNLISKLTINKNIRFLFFANTFSLSK